MYLIDSANPKTIKQLLDYYTVSGITTNPSLMSKENRTDFLHHLKDLEKAAPGKRLFVQINAEQYDDMVKEAGVFKATLTNPFTLKVPATKHGYKVMRTVYKDIDVAATAVASFHQALQAIEAGAKTIIIYVNRMIMHGHHPYSLIENLNTFIKREHLPVKIMAASFKQHDQIEKALLSGADQVTVPPLLFENMFLKPLTEKSVKDFSKDFKDRYNKTSIEG